MPERWRIATAIVSVADVGVVALRVLLGGFYIYAGLSCCVIQAASWCGHGVAVGCVLCARCCCAACASLWRHVCVVVVALRVRLVASCACVVVGVALHVLMVLAWVCMALLFSCALEGVLCVRGRCYCAACAFWCFLGTCPPVSTRRSVHPTRTAKQRNHKRQLSSWTSRPAACVCCSPRFPRVDAA